VVAPISCTPALLLRAAVALALAVTLSSGLLLALCGIDLLCHLPSFFPACLFHAVTSHPCPGCGMTRAFLLLGQLRLDAALAAHPLAPGLLLAMLWTLLGAPGRTRIPHDAVAATLLILVIGVWLARLLVAGPCLSN
jgi:hypothetical protein